MFNTYSYVVKGLFARREVQNVILDMWLTDAADGGCGGGVDFAPMHAIRSVGQCDVNIPSLSPRGSRSKAIANETTGTSTSTGVHFEP